jgi:hypothetical protein
MNFSVPDFHYAEVAFDIGVFLCSFLAGYIVGGIVQRG